MCVCEYDSLSSLRICRMRCSRTRRDRWRLVCRCIGCPLAAVVVAVEVAAAVEVPLQPLLADSYFLHAKYYFVLAVVEEAPELVPTAVEIHVAFVAAVEYYYSPQSSKHYFAFV